MNYYFWGKDSSEKFKKALNENIEELKSIRELSITNPKETRTKFTSLILKIADTAGIKQNNRRKKNVDNNPPWFDLECRDFKNEIRKQGKSVKREPYNADARTKLFIQKKNFKNFVKKKKKKKREYKEGILQDSYLE